MIVCSILKVLSLGEMALWTDYFTTAVELVFLHNHRVLSYFNIIEITALSTAILRLTFHILLSLITVNIVIFIISILEGYLNFILLLVSF
jgi:hypothetical protein